MIIQIDLGNTYTSETTSCNHCKELISWSVHRIHSSDDDNFSGVR